jgi:hypothetical protein
VRSGFRRARSLRGALLILLGAGSLTLAGAASAGAATTYYAKSGTSGSCTTHADPCSLSTAVGLANTDGDSVVLETGPTFLPGSEVNITHSIDIGGEPGQMPTVQGPSAASNVFNVTVPGTTIHDLHITQSNANVALRQVAGTAERLLVTVTGERACDSAGGLLRDSVCWSSNDDGLVVIAPSGGTFTPQLRNVTAIGGPAAHGIGLYGSAGETEQVDALNVIARGGAADVVTQQFAGNYSITLRNSNYATTDTSLGGSITAPGSNGNQTAAPVFVDAGSGNFAEAPSSPTIDAGLAEPAIGGLDLVRAPRVQPACLGGAPKPDIGAYELAPPRPPRQACEDFTIGNLKRKRNGSGKLTVTVPGSGNLTAAGKGLKSTGTTAAAAGALVLTLKATGKARRALSNGGKVKLKVKLSWTPAGGSANVKSDKVRLKKR